MPAEMRSLVLMPASRPAAGKIIAFPESVDCIMATSASLHELRMLKRSAPRTVARCGVGIRSILFTLCSWKCLRIFLRSNALYASYCKLWLNLGHGHGSPAERKMAMVIGWPLLKLNASTRGPRS
jgi:hypothetical protein